MRPPKAEISRKKAGAGLGGAREPWVHAPALNPAAVISEGIEHRKGPVCHLSQSPFMQCLPFILSSPSSHPTLLELWFCHVYNTKIIIQHLHKISRQEIACLRKDALNTGISTRVTLPFRALTPCMALHKRFLSPASVFSPVK